MSVFGLSYSAFLTICIAIVAVVLIVSIITGVVVAAYNGAFDFIGDWFNKTEQSDGGGSGGGGGNKDNPKDTLEQKDNSIQKADITLPTATPSGSYVSSNDTGYVPITDEINSAAAILVDVASGKAIAGKEADTRVYPASMTKVMTLLVAAENGKEAGKLLTVEQWMIDYQQKMGASGIMGFKAGEQVTFENALYLINYNSDTIACLMVAKHVAGSEEAFVELMNKKAKALGLTNTHFMNTTGLHDENHYTTCREMAAIMNCAMKNPVAGKIISAHSGRGIAVFENNKASRSATIYAAWFSDSNRFADDARVYGTSGNMVVIGGKTGYEDIPTACFVTIAEHQNGSKYICVTVGRTSEKQAAVSSKQSTTDTETVYREFAYKKVIKETFLAGELYNNLVSAPI